MQPLSQLRARQGSLPTKDFVANPMTARPKPRSSAGAFKILVFVALVIAFVCNLPVDIYQRKGFDSLAIEKEKLDSLAIEKEKLVSQIEKLEGELKKEKQDQRKGFDSLAIEKEKLDSLAIEKEKLVSQIEKLEGELKKEKQDHFFPFKISNQIKCASHKTITELSEATKVLYERHKIRVFPRNGFLLGVIRHGGFLPQEDIDADLGVIYTDLNNLVAGKSNVVGAFAITPKPTEKNWANWKGKDPISGKPFPFFGVGISRSSFKTTAHAYYPYPKNNLFYPRASIVGSNHAGSIKEVQRYNKEDADYRLVDTDEKLNETNYELGKQIGTIFPNNFDCMVEKQFYFTKILVPCDYETILQAQYGKNWRRVEKRSKWEALKLSDETNKEFHENGPLPLCS
jgi:hypothetical protein